MGYGPLNHWTTSKSRFSNVFLGRFRTFFCFCWVFQVGTPKLLEQHLSSTKNKFRTVFPMTSRSYSTKIPGGWISDFSQLHPGFRKKRQMQESTYCSMWWQLKHFYFHPWGNDPIWRAYFSTGLKPPTRIQLVFFISGTEMFRITT